MKRDLTKTTHGKNGVPALEVVLLPNEIEQVRAMPCTQERHDLMRGQWQLFEALTLPEEKIQKDEDGTPLCVTKQCSNCGTNVSRVASEEAQLRLEETQEETAERHRQGRRL